MVAEVFLIVNEGRNQYLRARSELRRCCPIFRAEGRSITLCFPDIQEALYLLDLEAQGYENRQMNGFHQNDSFKSRVIVLEKNGSISECLMESYVMFYVVDGEGVINKEGETILNTISRLALHIHSIPYCNHL